MSDEKKPTAQDRMFVKALVKTKGNQTEAALIATKAKDRSVAQVRGAQIMAKPAVQRLLQQYLDELYPDHNKDFVDLMRSVAQRAIASENLKEKGDAMEKLSKVLGHQAPKETHSKNLKATFKWPGAED